MDVPHSFIVSISIAIHSVVHHPPDTRDITPLIPSLISLLNRSTSVHPDPETFIAASDALQELMSKSALSDGSGSRTLTEPLLLWLDASAGQIIEATLSSGVVDELSHSLCKLLVALGDHSTSYIAANIASSAPVSVAPSQASVLPIHIHTAPHSHSQKNKGELTQTFLRLVLAYTGLPGYFGVDEEESELTLPFWYLFQEALWCTDFYVGDGEEGVAGDTDKEGVDGHAAQVGMAKAVYSELVRVLRRKVAYPPPSGNGNGNGNGGWSKGLFVTFRSLDV
jgi:hypothetical protein